MEITQDIRITFEQESLIDMHSIMNTLNLLSLELHMISRNAGGSAAIEHVLHELYRIGGALRDRERAHHEAGRINEFIHSVREAVTQARMQINSRSEAAADMEDSALNIESIFTIMRVRAREIVARADDPYGWVDHHITELRHNFEVFFDAIQRNSKGAYRISTSADQRQQGDYLIELDISSPDGESIAMPAVFQDVTRDLIANARKYTAPGGRISTVLHDDSSRLLLRVQDSGIGIPTEEIERVVIFGERGSNVADRPTRGGGFGLTKAYFVTRQCGGRMWIDSQPGSGTAIEIRLPR
ncbi:ATP-binding protein [Spirochaeta africana]|uniref:histidine kinase n=1 Tax=Spirochaeta africana (strain ATCC 700263 / DSM 8902 / Z-7692) TaxID=889378 RepID=H9UFR8_SPIAZ|nr:ATP-binding protein [Spirochaeta africana]AFG36361.1 histidine kinase [Spirochaeta africana DSM 8902]